MGKAAAAAPGALGAVGLQIGLAQNEVFRVKPEAVAGQETFAKAFPAGANPELDYLHPPLIGFGVKAGKVGGDIGPGASG